MAVLWLWLVLLLACSASGSQINRFKSKKVEDNFGVESSFQNQKLIDRNREGRIFLYTMLRRTTTTTSTVEVTSSTVTLCLVDASMESGCLQMGRKKRHVTDALNKIFAENEKEEKAINQQARLHYNQQEQVITEVIDPDTPRREARWGIGGFVVTSDSTTTTTTTTTTTLFTGVVSATASSCTGATLPFSNCNAAAG